MKKNLPHYLRTTSGILELWNNGMQFLRNILPQAGCSTTFQYSNIPKMGNLNLLFVLITNLILFNLVFAGNTGKIVGHIKDKVTKEPILGGNIIIEGTNWGAATDMEGYYYILNIPPGTYQLKISYLGYSSVTVKGVKVNVDLTTEINVELESSAIETGTVEVIAEQPIIQKDITSTRKTTTGQELNKAPGVESTADVFKVFGGVVIDSKPQSLDLGNGARLQVKDESLKDVHIRGGRGGEVLYMVDGMPVTHPIYGGRSVLDLNVNDVENMELLTGAFSAEYGQAQSGVINITTRSGKSKLEGGIEYKTDQPKIWSNSYDTQFLSFYLGGPEPLTRQLLPAIGLGIPYKFSYFISANVNFTNSAYNNHRTRDDLNILGIKIKERQNNDINFNGKLDFESGGGIYAALSYHGSWKQWSNFDWLWKQYPDNTADYIRNNYNVNFKFTHMLSKSTFYNLNFGYMGLKYKASLTGKNPGDFWVFYLDSSSYVNQQGMDYNSWNDNFSGMKPYIVESKIEAPTIDPSTGFFNNKGFESIWRDDVTGSFTFKGDITSQIHTEHLVKAGIEVQHHDIQYIDISDGGVTLSSYGNYLLQEGTEYIAPTGPFKEFGQNRWVFDAFPWQGAVYIQEKFEKSSLIINAGFRLEWLMPGSSVENSEWKRQWEFATGLNAGWKKIQYTIMPRFGISFPILDNTVLFFSYGHYTQFSDLQFYYRDPFSGSFTGNPGLKPEKTITYEFGFTRKLFADFSIDVKSYAKDISEQIGTTRLRTTFGIPVDLYDNIGYARARGLEFELMKKGSGDMLSGKINYTIQWANGYSSSAFDDYIRSSNDLPNPIRERRLSWDVRHQIVFQASLISAKDKHISLFGFELPDMWDITIFSNFSSGYPYTPGSTDPIELQVLENTKEGPFIFSTDIKVKKYFELAGIRLSVSLDIVNLFDEKNTQIGYGFNNWSGKPFRFGDTVQDTYEGYNWRDMYYLMNPQQFSTGRYAKFGMSLNF